MSVGEQVVTIYIGSGGLLDDVPLNAIVEFAAKFLRHLAKEHPEYVDEINKTKAFSDELAEKVSASLKQFKGTKQ
jgi:F-type H+-transporting ATPase subunit alpha